MLSLACVLYYTILFTRVLYVASWGVALQDTGIYNSDSESMHTCHM